MLCVLFCIVLLCVVLLLFVIVFVLGGCVVFMCEFVCVLVVGFDLLVGQGFEMCFSLKLCVQNLNDVLIDYDGILVVFDLNGVLFVSGVSDWVGIVLWFGEVVFDVFVLVLVFVVVWQVWNLFGVVVNGELLYVLCGWFVGSVLGMVCFNDVGMLCLLIMLGWGGQIVWLDLMLVKCV